MDKRMIRFPVNISKCIIAFFLLVVPSIIFGSCGYKEVYDSEQEVTEAKTERQSEVSTETITETERQAIQSLNQRLMLDGYDLLDVSLIDDGYVALYHDISSANPNEMFVVNKYDTKTNEMILMGSTFGNDTDYELSKEGKNLSLRFVSLDPIAVADERTKSIYNISKEGVYFTKIDDTAELIRIFCLKSTIYALTGDGRIIKANTNGSETIWEKKGEVSKVLFAFTDDNASVTLKLDGNNIKGGDVYLKLNVSTGDEETYIVPYKTLCESSIDSGKHIFIYSGYYKEICLVSGAKQQVISVSSEDVATNNILSCSISSVNGNDFLFYSRDKMDEVSNVFLVDLSHFELEPWDEVQKEPYVVPDYSFEHIEKRAKEIEDKYGIIIVYKNLPDKLMGYKLQTDDNGHRILNSIEYLDQILGLYPNDFFRELMDGWINSLTFYVSPIITGDDPNMFLQNPFGVTSGNLGKEAQIILKTEGCDHSDKWFYDAVIHEISHIVDQRINKYNHSFEKEWNSLNPKRFDYSRDSYCEEDAERNITKYTSDDEKAYNEKIFDEVYFVDAYARVAATEDRARIWEYVMKKDGIPDFFGGEHILKKAEYYFQEVRNCMNSESWPMETEWEKRIKGFD